MTLRFRPMPGLTVAVLICLPILIGLGVWQYQRWHWKMDVLSEIDAAVTADPLQGIAAMIALDESDPVDFRRIQLSADAEAVGDAWHVYAPLGSIQWQPFRQVVSGADEALVGFRPFDDRVKDSVSLPNIEGPRAGYVRRVRSEGRFSEWFGANHNPDLNRWFSVNPDGAWMPNTPLYIELDPTETDASRLPIRRPDIPNNHFSYMLTWWSFAIILLIIYLMLHRRAGRLSWQ